MHVATGQIYKTDKGDSYEKGYYIQDQQGHYIRLLTEYDLEEPPSGNFPTKCDEHFDVEYTFVNTKYSQKQPPGATVQLKAVNNRDYDVLPDRTSIMGVPVPPGVVYVGLYITGNTWQKMYHSVKGVQGQVSEGGGYNQASDPIIYDGEVNRCAKLYGSSILENRNNVIFNYGPSLQIECVIGPDQRDADQFWDYYTKGLGGNPACVKNPIYNSCA